MLPITFPCTVDPGTAVLLNVIKLSASERAMSNNMSSSIGCSFLGLQQIATLLDYYKLLLIIISCTRPLFNSFVICYMGTPPFVHLYVDHDG